MSEHSDTKPLAPAPATIDIKFRGKERTVTYEQAFAYAYAQLEQKQYEAAAELFKRLQQFRDRGPRAFIMQAFCEAAASRFDRCSEPLTSIFEGESNKIAVELLNAFVSYHTGIRQEGVNMLADLVNRHRDLPTLCLVLGDMFYSLGKNEMARRSWSLAVKRDWFNGAVALVASQQLHKLAALQALNA